jgi:tight adherence protein B
MGDAVLMAAALVALSVALWPTRPLSGSTADAVRAHQPLADRLGTRWRAVLAGRPGPRRRHPWVADLAEVTAVGLDAGLDLASAALVAARSPSIAAAAPWLGAHLTASVEAGHGVAVIRHGEADLTAQEQLDLAVLEAAWRLAEEAGAATAVVTAAAARSIRDQHAAADRVSVVAAGPRASMWLLSALPVAGPAAAVLVGIGPGRLYATDAARLSALAGVLLTATGWWWSRGLLRRAQRPGRTDGSVA